MTINDIGNILVGANWKNISLIILCIHIFLTVVIPYLNSKKCWVKKEKHSMYFCENLEFALSVTFFIIYFFQTIWFGVVLDLWWADLIYMFAWWKTCIIFLLLILELVLLFIMAKDDFDCSGPFIKLFGALIFALNILMVVSISA